MNTLDKKLTDCFRLMKSRDIDSFEDTEQNYRLRIDRSHSQPHFFGSRIKPPRDLTASMADASGNGFVFTDTTHLPAVIHDDFEGFVDNAIKALSRP